MSNWTTCFSPTNTSKQCVCGLNDADLTTSAIKACPYDTLLLLLLHSFLYLQEQYQIYTPIPPSPMVRAVLSHSSQVLISAYLSNGLANKKAFHPFVDSLGKPEAKICTTWQVLLLRVTRFHKIHLPTPSSPSLPCHQYRINGFSAPRLLFKSQPSAPKHPSSFSRNPRLFPEPSHGESF